MKNLFTVSMSLLLLLILVTFQNCAKVQFLSQNAVLVAKTETEENHAIEQPENIEDPNQEVPPSDDNDDPIVEQGEQEFICVLAGPGNSVRLGVSSEFLAENGRTPETVCMSEHACREIVSQKFTVKGPEYRGFCPNNNPHVIPLSDEQVQAKIDEL